MQISRSEAPECFYGIQELNEHFLSVPMTTPILTLQWCNILILLNFDDQTLWSEVMQTTNRQLKPGTRLVSYYQMNLNTCNFNIGFISFILNTLNFDINVGLYIRGVTIQEKCIAIYCNIFSLYCDILRYIFFLIFSVKSN